MSRRWGWHTADVEIRWRRAAAYAMCRDGDQRLLLTRFASEGNPDHHKWTMPGGGMEWGESPEDTVKRELEEETGLVGDPQRVLGVFSHWLTPGESLRGEAGHVIGLVYGVSDLRGDLRTEWPDGTTDAAGWFTLSEVRSLQRVPLVDFVLKYI